MGRRTDNPLARRLAGVINLDDEDLRVLDGWCADAREMRADRHLAREGDRPGDLCILLDGWACRHKLLANGTRQIVGFMLPGDACDVPGAVVARTDHGVTMLTPGRVALTPRQAVFEAAARRPAAMRALWWCALADASTARAWLANVGRRGARERVAHLLCELWVRAGHVGPTSGDRFQLPATQSDLADAVGLTPVHVNRVLGQLRGTGLVDYEKRTFIIPDLPRLAAVAGFDPSYLHLDRAVVGGADPR